MHRRPRRFAAIALGLMLVGSACLGFQISGWSSSNSDCSTDAPWASFVDEPHGFMVRYPDGYIVAESPLEQASAGAVVTLVPATDPSMTVSGVRTNLFEVSITIGVTEATAAVAPENPACSKCTLVGRPGEGQDDVGVLFLRCQQTEGAAGNRYSTLRFSTVCEPYRYELVLFMHYGNPGCYAPGTIEPFDPAPFLYTFEAIVDTFRCWYDSR